MAYGQRGGYSKGKKFGGQKGRRTGVRLTGLFKAKRPGLLVGTARPEEVEALVALIKAGGAEKGIAFFVNKNQDAGAVWGALTCDIAQEQGGGGSSGGRRRIEEDPEDPPEGEERDDL